jgi:hypothetical protein
MSALRAGTSHRQSSPIVLSWTHAVCFPSFPSTEIHPHAEIAAESPEFAGRSGLLLGNARCLVRKPEPAEHHRDFPDRRGTGFPEAATRNAFETGQFRNKVCAAISCAASPSGVNGTPTFFINGMRHDGCV